LIGIALSNNPLVPEWAFAFHQIHPPTNYNVEYALVKAKPSLNAREPLAQHYSRSCPIQSAYEAAAILANWDRANLER